MGKVRFKKIRKFQQGGIQAIQGQMDANPSRVGIVSSVGPQSIDGTPLRDLQTFLRNDREFNFNKQKDEREYLDTQLKNFKTFSTLAEDETTKLDYNIQAQRELGESINEKIREQRIRMETILTDPNIPPGQKQRVFMESQRLIAENFQQPEYIKYVASNNLSTKFVDSMLGDINNREVFMNNEDVAYNLQVADELKQNKITPDQAIKRFRGYASSRKEVQTQFDTFQTFLTGALSNSFGDADYSSYFKDDFLGASYVAKIRKYAELGDVESIIKESKNYINTNQTLKDFITRGNRIAAKRNEDGTLFRNEDGTEVYDETALENYIRAQQGLVSIQRPLAGKQVMQSIDNVKELALEQTSNIPRNYKNFGNFSVPTDVVKSMEEGDIAPSLGSEVLDLYYKEFDKNLKNLTEEEIAERQKFTGDREEAIKSLADERAQITVKNELPDAVNENEDFIPEVIDFWATAVKTGPEQITTAAPRVRNTVGITDASSTFSSTTTTTPQPNITTPSLPTPTNTQRTNTQTLPKSSQTLPTTNNLQYNIKEQTYPKLDIPQTGDVGDIIPAKLDKNLGFYTNNPLNIKGTEKNSAVTKKFDNEKDGLYHRVFPTIEEGIQENKDALERYKTGKNAVFKERLKEKGKSIEEATIGDMYRTWATGADSAKIKRITDEIGGVTEDTLLNDIDTEDLFRGILKVENPGMFKDLYGRSAEDKGNLNENKTKPGSPFFIKLEGTNNTNKNQNEVLNSVGSTESNPTEPLLEINQKAFALSREIEKVAESPDIDEWGRDISKEKERTINSLEKERAESWDSYNKAIEKNEKLKQEEEKRIAVVDEIPFTTNKNGFKLSKVLSGGKGFFYVRKHESEDSYLLELDRGPVGKKRYPPMTKAELVEYLKNYKIRD